MKVTWLTKVTWPDPWVGKWNTGMGRENFQLTDGTMWLTWALTTKWHEWGFAPCATVTSLGRFQYNPMIIYKCLECSAIILHQQVEFRFISLTHKTAETSKNTGANESTEMRKLKAASLLSLSFWPWGLIALVMPRGLPLNGGWPISVPSYNFPRENVRLFWFYLHSGKILGLLWRDGRLDLKSSVHARSRPWCLGSPPRSTSSWWPNPCECWKSGI